MLRIPKDEREIEQAARGILLQARVPVVDQVGSFQFGGKRYTPDMVVKTDGDSIAVELKRVRNMKDLERAHAQAFAYASQYKETIVVLYDITGIVDIPKSQIADWESKSIFMLPIKH